MSRGEAYKLKLAESEQAYARRVENSARSNAVCEACGRKGNAFLHYRLDPRNWRAERKRLCPKCAGEGWFREGVGTGYAA